MRLFYRIVTTWFIGVIVILAFAPSAFAIEGDPLPAANEGAVFSIDLGLWTVLQSLAIPVIVGLLTKAAAKPAHKVLLSLIVNAVGALLSAVVVTDAAYLSKQTVFTWLLGTLGTIAFHYGIYKPIEVTGSTAETNKLGPRIGIG